MIFLTDPTMRISYTFHLLELHICHPISIFHHVTFANYTPMDIFYVLVYNNIFIVNSFLLQA
jgi:hypothetical protein